MGKEKKPRKAEPVRAAAPSRWIEGAGRHSAALAIGLVALATLRIVTTYTVFNHTIDEPAHIACGMEWLDRGTYTVETQHPPLARVLAALGPFLAGRRMPP